MIDFSTYKFHPSSLGKLMTNQPGKKDTTNIKELGETAKGHLLECWVSERYKREKEFSNKYTEKGTLQEEESITLYSRVTRRFHKKNSDTISNDYYIGTPDLFEGEDIYHATEIIDIKSSWDIFTFYNVLAKPINKDYEWQLTGYEDMTGAKLGRLVYCLVDTPDHLIEDQKRKLQWAMNVIDPMANKEFLKKCDQIVKNNKFDDIPIQERYIEFQFQRDEEKIEQARKRVIIGREFLQSLEESRKSTNL